MSKFDSKDSFQDNYKDNPNYDPWDDFEKVFGTESRRPSKNNHSRNSESGYGDDFDLDFDFDYKPKTTSANDFNYNSGSDFDVEIRGASRKDYGYKRDNDYDYNFESPFVASARSSGKKSSRTPSSSRSQNAQRTSARNADPSRQGSRSRSSAARGRGRSSKSSARAKAWANTSTGTKIKLLLILLLLILIIVFVVRCSVNNNDDVDPNGDIQPGVSDTTETPDTPDATPPGTLEVIYNEDGTFTLPTPTTILTPRPQINYEELYGTMVPYDGLVEHIFFHPVVCYPELAFDGDDKAKGIDDWMVTLNEYNKILQSLYDKGYIIVNMNDVWSEYTDENGVTRMKRETLMLPEGKKPLIISYDDTNYYQYMLTNGFTHKLIIGDDGEIWSYGIDPQGNTVISQDLDAITILDKFVEEHPDFSLNGAKGCLALTGYEGILGYRTQTDSNNTSAEFEANRQKEIEAVQPIIKALKETGWYFGSHSWGHINLAGAGYDSVVRDTERWMSEVGSLIGETSLYFYPHGARPDGDDVTQTGPSFKYLQSKGFRVFSSVGIESYSSIKSDISAVICDRLHPDGTTLRWSRDRYLQFYDAKDILEISVRPDLGYDFG